MAETPNVDNLIDYSRKDIIKTTKNSQELVTQYDGKINEESLKKLGETLNLNQNQISEMRVKLKQIIAEIKNNFQNPYMDKTSKDIELRYDKIMEDLKNLNAAIVEDLANTLGLDGKKIGNEINNKIINARELRDINKYGVEKTNGKPDMQVSKTEKKPDIQIGANESKNPYPNGSMMGNQWDKRNAGK